MLALVVVTLTASAQITIFSDGFESVQKIVYDSLTDWQGNALAPIGDDGLIEVVGQVFVVPEKQRSLERFSLILASDERDTSGQSLFFRGVIMPWNGDRAAGPVLFESQLAELPPSTLSAQEYVFATDGLLLEPGETYVAFFNANTENWDSNPTWAAIAYQPEDQVPGGGVWVIDTDTDELLLTASAWDGTFNAGDLATRLVFAPPVLLSGLSLSNGALKSPFDPEKFTYDADVSAGTSSTTVTAIAARADATIEINGLPVQSGVASDPIAVGAGVTLIEVSVTSADGASTFLYTMNLESNSYELAVPNLVGLQEPVAREIIELAELVVGDIGTAASETVPAGEVISQDPTAGSLVSSGSAVDLVVSFGLPRVSVPDVSGLSRPAAQTALESASLIIGQVSGVESATIPVDEVLDQSPGAGELVAPGTAIDLSISVGPIGIVVPDVTGELQAIAEGSITTASLVVGEVARVNSATVSEGSIISQTPEAGSLAAPGWAVDLDVSSGIGRIVPFAGPDPPDTSLIDTLPVDTDTGLPIVIAIDGLDMLVDTELKDPLTGLAQCVDWILACVDMPAGRDFDDCVRSAPSCSTSEPWLEDGQCCPSACYADYSAQRISGSEPLKALTDVFLIDSSCYPGMSELLQ